MKFLVDMNLSPGWVEFLFEAGFEAIHWSSVGLGDASDAELMRWAADHGHIVLTSDLGFGSILAATERRRPAWSRFEPTILRLRLSARSSCPPSVGFAAELNDGALLSVDAGRGAVAPSAPPRLNLSL